MGDLKTKAAAPIATKTSLDPMAQRQLLRFMLLTRRLEERLVNLYRQGKVVGGLYRSLGQEATAVGSAFALGPDDYLGPLIRNLGSMLTRGVRPEEVFTQYMARSDSPTGGKDANNHMGDVAGRGLVAPISVLGSLVGVMGGIALASKIRKRKSVSLTYIGDGGASTGEFCEALNFAAVKKLPLIVIAENNGYAYSTPTSEQMAIDSLVQRGEAFGVTSESVDGNDVLAVYEATRRAVDRARSGKGPSLVEAVTFRMRGHAEHDDQRYVPKELIGRWAARDPIDRFRTLLRERQVMSQDEIDRLDTDVQAEVTRGLETAERSPMPPPERALEGVYHGVPRAHDGKPRIR